MKSCYILLILLSVCSCRQSMNPLELKNWTEEEENGLVKSVESESMNLEAVYLPWQLVAYRYCRESADIDQNHYDSCKTDYEDKHYVELRLRKPEGKAAESPWDEKFISMVDFELDDHLILIAGSDTMNCTFHHLERPFNLRPYLSVITVFDKKGLKDISENLRLDINIPGDYPIKETLEFQQLQLKKIPKLQIPS